MISKKKVLDVLTILAELYPDAKCALDHKNTYELIVAVALSAQTTDKSVNLVTPKLFELYPTPYELAVANIEDVEGCLKRIGMYRTKSKNIIGLAIKLIEDYDGEVPSIYDELIKLPGVGRKTANVVLSVGFGEPRIAVDTHVFRVSNRIGMVKEKDVLKTELKLMERIPKKKWSEAHHSLIFHGRNICTARSPKCGICPINDICEKKL